jgi:hypothetical protein
MADDTAIGGPVRSFPVTRWSAIVRARSEDPVERARALESLMAAYWKPVYKYIRARWGELVRPPYYGRSRSISTRKGAERCPE